MALPVIVLTALAWSAVLLAWIPSAFFVLEIALAWRCLARPAERSLDTPLLTSPEAGADSVTVLIPAHNEAGGIAHTLAAVRAAMRPQDRLLVVADNCTDETAAVAASFGAEVLEREHATLRGKSYALAAGVAHLQAAPPAMLLILDADCQIGATFIVHLAQRCAERKTPVQALYLMTAAAGDTRPSAVLAEFAWRIRNWARPLGVRKLGMPAALNGSGMIFPWQQICAIDLANGNLSEDYALGLDLVRAGHSPWFDDAVRVTSVFPSSVKARAVQRTRWEHGHLNLIIGTAPRLLLEGLRAKHWALVATACDLVVPPLALLSMLALSASGLAALVFFLGGSPEPLAWALACDFLLALSLILAWFGWGRGLVSARVLAAIPGYMVSKINLYSRFVTAREKQWKRTERDG